MNTAHESVQSTSVSVVIPTFERPETLRGSLEAALRQRYGGEFEIVVVDDAGGDEATRDVVAAAELSANGVPIRLFVSPRRGAAAARNAGAREARGRLLLFVDDDILLPPDGVARFAAQLTGDPNACVNGTWMFKPSLVEALSQTPAGRFRLSIEQWVKDGLRTVVAQDDLIEPELMTACNLALTTSNFRMLGGFDESFPSAGYEDQDLSLRARSLGLRLVIDPAILCLHDDRRLDLDELLARIERGAATAVLMWRKHPSFFDNRSLIRENDALRWSEGLGPSLKKLAKSALASAMGRRILGLTAYMLERVAPGSRPLHHVYWALTGVAVFRGVRRGIARFGRPGQ